MKCLRSVFLTLVLTAFGLSARAGSAPKAPWKFKLGDGVELKIREIPKKARAGNPAAGDKPTPRRDFFIATEKDGRPVQHVRFTNVERSTQLLIPSDQPLEGYFLLRRQGGGNSRVLLIAQDGRIINVAGGDLWAAPEQDQLVVIKTDPAEPPPQLAVVELGSGKLRLELKNATEPRILLERGRGYRLWKTDAGTFVEPTSPGDEKVALVAIDGKSVSLAVPLGAEARAAARKLTRLLPGNTPSPAGLPTAKYRWKALK